MAYRARIVTYVGHFQTDNWVDIVVSGAGESEKRACEIILESERHQQAAPEVHFEIQRDCKLEPLPTVPRLETSAYLLITPWHIAESDLAKMDPLTAESKVGRGDRVPRVPGPITVTHMARPSSKAECGSLLARQLAAAKERSRGAEDSPEVLDSQIEIVESEYATAHTAYENKAAECVHIERAMTKVERACNKDPAPPGCERFHMKNFSWDHCEAEKTRLEQRQGRAVRALELLREIKLQPQDPRVHRPVCRPES